MKSHSAWVVMAIDQPTSMGLMGPWVHKEGLNGWWASLTAICPEQLSETTAVHPGTGHNGNIIWVRSRNCDCLVTWFCYQLIAKPGNKTAAVPWPDPYSKWHYLWLILLTHWLLACWIGLGNWSIYLHFISFVDTRLQNFAFLCSFPYNICYFYYFSLCSSGRVVIAVGGLLYFRPGN